MLLIQAAEVNAQSTFKHLILTPTCSENPSQMIRWRIKNENNYPVTYTWKVDNGGSNAPASSQFPQAFVALPGDNFIYIKRWGIGNNETVIYVNNVEQHAGRKKPGNSPCSTFNTYLTCVKKIDACTRQATFGYNNTNTNTTINVPLSDNNRIENGTVFSGQPISSFPPGNYPNAFKVRFACTDTIRWKLTGPFGSKTAYSSADFDSACQNIIKLFVNYIHPLANGTYTADFGYENTGDDTVIVNDPAKNYFVGDNVSGTPVHEFLPGRHNSAFTVTFNSNELQWHVVNSEGVDRMATADAAYAGHNIKPIKNFVTCIRHNPNGTNSAVFGYENLDSIAISIPAGGGKNYLIHETEGQLPLTLFEPGKYDSVMTIDFTGDNVKWALLGPEGIMHYAIASDEYCKICDNGSTTITPVTPLPCINILPNPVRDHITVTTNLSLTANKQVYIYDSMGNRMLSKTFCAGQNISLNLCSLRKGAYVLKIICGNSTLQKGFMKL